MTACAQCGFIHQCICPQRPQLQSSLRLSLLTHPNELTRASNTGRWLLDILPSCERLVWQRTPTAPQWLEMLAQPDLMPMLLFPSAESQPLSHALEHAQEQGLTPHFIILDATWQEANKMMRKSPWLDSLPRVEFQPQSPSQFRLRRNQQPDALCTLEVAAQLLRGLDEEENADQLEHFFRLMMDTFQADRSGHRLK